MKGLKLVIVVIDFGYKQQKEIMNVSKMIAPMIILILGKDLVILGRFRHILDRGYDTLFGIKGVELISAAVCRIDRDWLHSGVLLFCFSA